LKQLADKIKNEDKDKDEVISFLKSAYILDKNGDFSEHYSHLNNYFKELEDAGVCKKSKIFYVPVMKNGIFIDKVLKVSIGSYLYNKLTNATEDGNLPKWIEEIEDEK